MTGHFKMLKKIAAPRDGFSGALLANALLVLKDWNNHVSDLRLCRRSLTLKIS